MKKSNPPKNSNSPSEWGTLLKTDKPQKGIGLVSTLRHIQRPDGLVEKGLKIYNLYDISRTYPESHNQRKKIQDQMTEIFWKCDTEEQDLIEIQFLKDLLVWG